MFYLFQHSAFKRYTTAFKVAVEAIESMFQIDWLFHLFLKATYYICEVIVREISLSAERERVVTDAPNAVNETGGGTVASKTSLPVIEGFKFKLNIIFHLEINHEILQQLYTS